MADGIRGMGRARVFGVALALALAGCVAAPEVTPPSGTATAPAVLDPGQIFALLAIDAPRARLTGSAEAMGYELVEVAELSALDLALLAFRMPQGVTGPEAIRALEAAEPASTVGVNHAFTLQNTAPTGGLDYAGALIGWPASGCAATTPVGLIDAAVPPEALAAPGVRVVARDFTGGAPAESAHGREVAAILADPKRLTGVTLYSASVVRGAPGGATAAGADGIIRALDWLGASGVRLANVSLAGPYNKLLDRAVRDAAARGMILVAAAGNDGPGAEARFPAADRNVIAVTAVDANLRIYRDAARGPHIDVAAPGVDVLIAAEGGARFATGTSIAAPFVTARLAAAPELAAANGVEDALALLSAATRDLGDAGRDDVFGYGVLDLAESCAAQ